MSSKWGYTYIYPTVKFQKNVPYLFDQLDLNHDGVVDYNEVLGIL